MGNVEFHRFLVPENRRGESEIRGGHWHIEENKILFYGRSLDYGSTNRQDFIYALRRSLMSRRFQGYEIYFSGSDEIQFLPEERVVSSFDVDYLVPLSDIPDHGRFGVPRKFDIHTGIDVYMEPGDPVFAIEDGTVKHVSQFTGEEVGSPWWNTTYAVQIEGKSGIILYGEIEPSVEKGKTIKKGEIVGNVKQVLKNDKGLPMTMLHLELYDHEYEGEGETWKLGEEQPNHLMNVEILFQEA
jgi:murein DD-endopeptidase MepM/ murein hydrolase activator NlpD